MVSVVSWSSCGAVLTLEHNLAALAALAQRVDRRADLLAGREPEQHGRVEPVEEGDEHREGEEKEEQVAGDEVRGVQAHLDRLDNEFTSGLAERVRAEATVEPDTSPPGAVGLVVLELARQEDGDEDLEDAALHGDNGDDAEHGARRVPALEVPEEFEEGNHADDSTQVGNGRHGGTELGGARVDARSKEDRDQEED
jgi:hypothetical protein